MRYEPEQAPKEITAEYLIRELRRIADSIKDRYEISYAEPDKPRAGDVVYADGTHWNPGSGEGIYRFNLSASWSFVG